MYHLYLCIKIMKLCKVTIFICVYWPGGLFILHKQENQWVEVATSDYTFTKFMSYFIKGENLNIISLKILNKARWTTLCSQFFMALGTLVSINPSLYHQQGSVWLAAMETHGHPFCLFVCFAPLGENKAGTW